MAVAVQDQVMALEIGRSYAAAVRDEPAAQRLWVAAHPDHVELWLLVAPTDMETERRLYGASRPLYDLFPAASIRLYVVNPEYYDPFDLEMVLPQGMHELPLRPS